jgi:hypothetical protein
MSATSADVAAALQRRRFRFDDEKELQASISCVLTMDGIAHEREVTLAPGDIIDFLADGVGVEVKIKGSLGDVTRQLLRYAQSDRVRELVLVSTLMRLGNQPSTMNGKPLVFVSLLGSLL